MIIMFRFEDYLYLLMKASRTEFIDAREMRLCVRHWGDEDAPKLFMVHGWMDISASFQFVVDALERDWHVIAPDIRGFGHSGWAQGGYWFPDYLADLEVLLDHYSPDEPVRLLGHSLGGKITSIYAGIRPSRVAQLISLEGYGIVGNRPEMAPERLELWLDSQKEPGRLRPYPDKEAVIARLQQNNPRLTYERAFFLADYWTETNNRGEWIVMADPKHKLLPVMSRLDEVLACWSRIEAKVLFVEGQHSLLGIRMKDQVKAQEEIRRRASYIRDVRIALVEGAGHMLQHDQPEKVAGLIEDFLD